MSAPYERGNDPPAESARVPRSGTGPGAVPEPGPAPASGPAPESGDGPGRTPGGESGESDESAAVAAEVERYVREVVTRASLRGTAAPQDLLPFVYDEMRVLAGYLLRGERAGRTLQPTALAHEAYLRVARESRAHIRDPKHLLALSATMMRRVIVDYARARLAQKRGGERQRVSLDESLPGERGRAVDFVDLQRVLERLSAVDPRKAQVVEMIYFAGFTMEETAEALGVSSRTVLRDWEYARAWLARALG